jgi:hypothetical protein
MRAAAVAESLRPVRCPFQIPIHELVAEATE